MCLSAKLKPVQCHHFAEYEKKRKKKKTKESKNASARAICNTSPELHPEAEQAVIIGDNSPKLLPPNPNAKRDTKCHPRRDVLNRKSKTCRLAMRRVIAGMTDNLAGQPRLHGPTCCKSPSSSDLQDAHSISSSSISTPSIS